MTKQRTIWLSGPFTDQQLTRIIGLLREIDGETPKALFQCRIIDPDGSTEESERLLRQALPPLTDRATDFARAAYSDDSYPERQCDHCQRTYRGPAVYCSLECAVLDA